MYDVVAPCTHRNTEKSQIDGLKYIWYEKIRDLPRVLLPRLPVLGLAPLYVSNGAMRNHGCEEDGIKPWKGTIEARNQTPGQGEIEIGGVMYLARIAICNLDKYTDQRVERIGKPTPSVHQNRIAALGLDGFRGFDRLPWQLGESFPLQQRTPFLLPETILLAVGGVPDPVHNEVGNVQQDKRVAVPTVHRRGMVRQVKCTMAVA